MSSIQRIEELLALRATDGLSGEDAMELRRLLAEMPELDDDFDLAAAAIDQVFEPDVAEELPEHLRARVADQAAEFFSTPGTSAVVTDLSRPTPRAASRASTLPWMAAAAALAVAVIGWWPRFSPEPKPEPATVVEAEPSPAELRASLLESGATLKLDWQATEDPSAAGAAGDIVWSDDLQQGYMRISGLAANDPTAEQYQLWIFSPEQDERYPVDGGVFDIPAGASEAVVPIDPKISVNGPVLFAVTVEKPGGVVVSSRERIVLLAQA